MTSKTLRAAIARVDRECLKLVLQKNHDYGDAWRQMRPSSITDQLLVKVLRIKQLEDLATKGKSPRVSEGILSELRDIHNYATLEYLRLSEGSRQE
jgi:hypothetical protein